MHKFTSHAKPIPPEMSTRRKHSRLDEIEKQCTETNEGNAKATVIWYDPDDPKEPERSIEEDDTPGTTVCFPEEQDEEELQWNPDDD